MESWLQGVGGCLGDISKKMNAPKTRYDENSWKKLVGVPGSSIHGFNIGILHVWFICSQEISLSPSTSCNFLKAKTWTW